MNRVLFLTLIILSASCTRFQQRGIASSQESATFFSKTNTRYLETTKEVDENGKKLWSKKYHPENFFSKRTKQTITFTNETCYIKVKTSADAEPMVIFDNVPIEGQFVNRKVFDASGNFAYNYATFSGDYQGNPLTISCNLYKKNIGINDFADAAYKYFTLY